MQAASFGGNRDDQWPHSMTRGQVTLGGLHHGDLDWANPGVLPGLAALCQLGVRSMEALLFNTVAGFGQALLWYKIRPNVKG